jgi:hypothetical protein
LFAKPQAVSDGSLQLSFLAIGRIGEWRCTGLIDMCRRTLGRCDAGEMSRGTAEMIPFAHNFGWT